jgi:NADPH:quinone reductase-like Zn-dependent oxidoreductase
MRAIQFDRFGGPEVLSLVELPDPEPGPGELLIDVRAASVIPGDWKLRAGHLSHLFDVTLPKIPGRDGAGVVSAIGPGVAAFAVGDAVCFVCQHEEQGSHAEKVVRPADAVVAKPAGLSFVEAAALMHAGVCAWITVAEVGAVRPGDRVLVHGGAGAIGGQAVQVARHLGAEVVATCHSGNLDYVAGLGAHRAVAYDREDFASSVRDIDCVVDLVGGATHARSYAALRPGGRLVWLIAAPFEDRSAEFGVELRQARIHDDPATLATVVGLAARGILRPQVSRTLPLGDAAAAHRRLEAGENSRGRIILLP